MAITDRDTKIQAIYVMGNPRMPHTWERLASALIEAGSIVLAERLNVQALVIDQTTESVVLYCDREEKEHPDADA